MMNYIFAASYSRAEIIGLLALIAALKNDVSYWLAIPLFVAWIMFCAFAQHRELYPR